MIDAVRRRLTPLRDRPIVYVLCILVAVGILASAGLWVRQNSETHARIHQLQDALCGSGSNTGLLPPILKVPESPHMPGWAKAIVAGANHAAQTVHCPEG